MRQFGAADKKRLRKQLGGKRRGGLPRSDVVRLRRRVADDFPSQRVAHPPQLVGFAVPQSDDVLRKKRDDKIFAIAADRYLSPIGNRIPSEGLDDVKR